MPRTVPIPGEQPIGRERPAMDIEALRDLEVLDAVSKNEKITQRSLATRLGIALGLTNLYLKRLVHKGYIKCVNVQPNRILYLITPKGIAEKTRLTYEFMEYSLHLYRQVRYELATLLGPLVASGQTRIAIYGKGEAAELAYLSLKELGLEPVAVFDGETQGDFLGIPIYRVRDHEQVSYDRVVVTNIGRSTNIVEDLVENGIPREKLLVLRQ